MHVVEHGVDRDVPSKGINKGSAKRLVSGDNQWTGWRQVTESAAHDLVWDPAFFGVFFCPEVHEIQFNIPKFHLRRFEMLGLVGVGFHNYRILNEFVLVGLEKLSQAIRERNAGHILNGDVDVIAFGT
jgi:hypothetical protein